jgi:sigma-B regulation protein RsbU (phosphoserine phosphatase)
VLHRANNLLIEKRTSGFTSVFLGIIDTQGGYVRYASAGHPATLLRRDTGEIHHLGSPSHPLGVFPQEWWKPGVTRLFPDDLLLLYTDGVIESRRGADFFGENRLEAILARRDVPVEQLPHEILEQALRFSDGRLADDIAVLAVQVTDVTTDRIATEVQRQGSLLE